MKSDAAKAITEAVANWAGRRDDIRAMALAGSWARGEPRDTSDLDLLLLSDQASLYRETAEWLASIDFAGTGHRPRSWMAATYGVVHSWHIECVPAAQIEFSFADCSWAATAPVDDGTRDVVEGGFRIIFDKDGLLARLVDAVMS